MKRPNSQIEYVEEIGLLKLFKYIKYLEAIQDRYKKLNRKSDLLFYGEYFKELYTEQE